LSATTGGALSKYFCASDLVKGVYSDAAKSQLKASFDCNEAGQRVSKVSISGTTASIRAGRFGQLDGH